MKKQIDIDTWIRKEQFLFFKDFEEPFYGVTVNIDCTNAYKKAKKLKYSLFLYYLHCSVVAVNQIENFRYRIENGEVFLYDQIDASTTVDRPDGTFGMSGSILYNKGFEAFTKNALIEMDRVRHSDKLYSSTGNNVIHYSALPWVNFTSLSHARKYSREDSCPKISFGKIMNNDGILSMPVSIHVHHSLVDALHIGQFIDKYQGLMNEL